MSEPLDKELSTAFMELKIKMVETNEKIQVMDNQIGVLKRVLHHTSLARQEIGTLPPETKAYKSVGRMFLVTDLTQVKSNLDEKISALTTRTTELETNKQFLEKSVKESEENIKEMLQQHKELNENNST